MERHDWKFRDPWGSIDRAYALTNKGEFFRGGDEGAIEPGAEPEYETCEFEPIAAEMLRLADLARPRYPAKGELPRHGEEVLLQVHSGTRKLGIYDAEDIPQMGGAFVVDPPRPSRESPTGMTGKGSYTGRSVAMWWPAPTAPESEP